MSRKVLIAITAAVVLGAAIASAGPATAMPLASQVQSQALLDHTMVVPVNQHKKSSKKYHKPRVTFGVTVPGVAVYPGFYAGSYYHPYVHVDRGAPYHCHRWADQYGHHQELCHRHW
jgi:hypothetical protein